nr:hypothetical protein [Streptomyces cinnamoneus]
MIVFSCEADVKVGIQPCGDLVGEIRADRLLADAADDLADQEAVGEPVVAGSRARFPAGGWRASRAVAFSQSHRSSSIIGWSQSGEAGGVTE